VLFYSLQVQNRACPVEKRILKRLLFLVFHIICFVFKLCCLAHENLRNVHHLINSSLLFNSEQVINACGSGTCVGVTDLNRLKAESPCLARASLSEKK